MSSLASFLLITGDIQHYVNNSRKTMTCQDDHHFKEKNPQFWGDLYMSVNEGILTVGNITYFSSPSLCLEKYSFSVIALWTRMILTSRQGGIRDYI
jgi:hypothetical protein